MNKRFLILTNIIFILFLIGFVNAIEPDLTKWELKQDPEGKSLLDEYWVDSLNNFHTQQNNVGIAGIYLVPKHQFTTGDSISYDVNVISHNDGTSGHLVLLTGDAYDRFGPVCQQDCHSYEYGITHMTLSFPSSNIFRLHGETPSGYDFTQDYSVPTNGTYELYIGTTTGHNGIAHLDYDDFYINGVLYDDFNYNYNYSINIYDIVTGVENSYAYPLVYDNYIVWTTWNHTQTYLYDIYVFDIEKNETTYVGQGDIPDLYGDKIVYSVWGSKQIKLYDIPSKSTSNIFSASQTTYDYLPSHRNLIYNDYIIFNYYNNTDASGCTFTSDSKSNIYMYNITTGEVNKINNGCRTLTLFDAYNDIIYHDDKYISGSNHEIINLTSGDWYMDTERSGFNGAMGMLYRKYGMKFLSNMSDGYFHLINMSTEEDIKISWDTSGARDFYKDKIVWTEGGKLKLAIIEKSNSAPTIDSYSPKLNFAMEEGKSQIFSVNASDVDGDNLNYLWKLFKIDYTIMEDLSIYDDFSGEVLNSSKWEIKNDLTGPGGLTDVYELDTVNKNYYIAQPTVVGDKGTVLTMKTLTDVGDIIEYDVVYNYGDGNQEAKPYFNGMPLDKIMLNEGYDCGGCPTSGTIGYWNGDSEVSNTLGLHHIKVEFNGPDNTKITYTMPDSSQWSYIAITINYPVEFGAGLKIGHNGMASYSFDNFRRYNSTTSNNTNTITSNNILIQEANTNDFTFSPNYTQTGNYLLNYFVSDGDLNNSIEWGINVTDINLAPNTGNIAPYNPSYGFPIEVYLSNNTYLVRTNSTGTSYTTYSGTNVRFNSNITDAEHDNLIIDWNIIKDDIIIFNDHREESYNSNWSYPSYFDYNFTEIGTYYINISVDDDQFNKLGQNPQRQAVINVFCTPNWVLNNTWSECGIDDLQSKNYYDSNNCGDDSIKPVDEVQSCGYCTPDIYDVNSTCQIDDTFTQDFFDNNECYAITGLDSDKVPLSNIYSCDYCTPNITSSNSSCQPDNTLTETFTDSNGCYDLTLLSIDAVPEPIIHNCTYVAPSSGGGGSGGGGGGGSSSCSSKWTCNNWSKCQLINGTGKQNCLNWIDIKKCRNPRNKPEFQTQKCTVQKLEQEKDIKINKEECNKCSVKNIHIVVTNKNKQIDIKVTKESGKPAEVEHDIEDDKEVYEYIKIDKGDLDDDEIKVAVIEFEIKKEWLNDNSLSGNKVSLYRYHNNIWNKLETNKTFEDDENIYYEAKTSGFSYFAIAGEKEEPIGITGAVIGVVKVSYSWLLALGIVVIITGFVLWRKK